jgi:hypothetical protein
MHVSSANLLASAARLVSGAALVAAIFAPATASAYSLEGFAWPGTSPTTPPLLLHADGWPEAAGGAAAVEASMAAAIKVWNEQGASNLVVVYGGASDQGLNDGDMIDVVGFEDVTAQDHTLAVSRWLTSSDGARIVACDIHVWAGNLDGVIDWHTGAQPPSTGGYDLQHVLTHEIGHCLGLGHSTDPNAIMYATTTPGTAVRDLAYDDILGLQALYGASCDDLDGDGFAASDACEIPGGDCDDEEPASHPGGVEVCNGADDDCNGTIDDNAEDGAWLYRDADGDGYGDPDDQAMGCEGGAFTADDSDCNDLDEYVHPGADDPVDGFDQDCDGAPEAGGCASTEGPPPSHTLLIESLLMLSLLRRKRRPEPARPGAARVRRKTRQLAMADYSQR